MKISSKIGMMLLVSVSSISAAHADTGGVYSASETYNFKVGAGHVGEVVSEIARQARATVQVDARDGGQKVSGVRGVYTLRGALEKVLAGTGWSIEIDDKGALVIHGADAQEIVVTARRVDFVETGSSLLTRTDTSLRHTPSTVDTITREVLDSQNAISFAEAMRNLPGVVYTVRGLTSQATIGQDTSGGATFNNGLRNSELVQNGPLTDVEAVEVLKGPASILVGADIAGGVINFVPKRATGLKQTILSFGVGSGSELLASFDTGGAISQDAGLFWRVNGLSEHAETLPQGYGRGPDQKVINPMLGYRAAMTKLDLSLQYFEKFTPYQPVSAYLPETDTFADYGDFIDPRAGTAVKSTRVSYDFEQGLVSTSDFMLRFRSRGQYQSAENGVQTNTPDAYDYPGIGMVISSQSELIRDKTISNYNDLYAKFDLFGMNHQVITAFDFRDSRYSFSFSFVQGYAVGGVHVDLAPLVEDPRYRTNRRQYGIIFQDQITAGKLHALIGLRKTIYRAESLLPSGYVYQEARANVLLPNGGLVYDVLPGLSVYVSYAKSFEGSDPSAVTYEGEQIPPTIRTQYEGGFKAGLLNEKLTVNASMHKYGENFSALRDAAHPGFYMLGRGWTGYGGEISLAGSITPTLKLLAGMQMSRGTVKDSSNEKVPRQATPNDTFNMWAIKSFAVGEDAGVDVGFGGNYNSSFVAIDPFTGINYQIDRSYVSVNGSLSIKKGPLTLNAMVNNILNHRNYIPSVSTAAIYYDVPRSYRITLTGKF